MDSLDWREPANDNRRVCPTCQGEVTGRVTKKYCGKACARIAERSKRDRAAENARRLAAQPERHCEHCATTFKGVPKDGKPLRFCSKVCAGQFMLVVNRLLVAPKAAKYIAYRPLCDCCGDRFTASQISSRLCSDECRAIDARQRSRMRSMANDNRDRSIRPCAECGSEFAPEYGNRRRLYCSGLCMGKALRRVAKGVRRARIRSTSVEPVNPIAVFDRDGWVCQICGVDTPRDLRGTHEDNAPELDHVFPLSRGGPHTYDNVQCACRSCNQDKSDIAPLAA